VFDWCDQLLCNDHYGDSDAVIWLLPLSKSLWVRDRDHVINLISQDLTSPSEEHTCTLRRRDELQMSLCDNRTEMWIISSTWNYAEIPARKWSQESMADFMLCAFRDCKKSAENVPPVEWMEESNPGLLCWEGDILSPLKDMDNVLKPVCLSSICECAYGFMWIDWISVCV